MEDIIGTTLLAMIGIVMGALITHIAYTTIHDYKEYKKRQKRQ